MRIRSLPEGFDRTAWAHRVNLNWTMTHPDDRGFATDVELERLHPFEDRLVEAVETDEHSILVLVVTDNGSREFIFYTRSPQELVGRLTATPQEEERYPLEIQAFEDPRWQFYEDALTRAASATD